MTTQKQDRIVTLNGVEYRIFGRAWWTNFALDNNGRIEVARIHAHSTSLRQPSHAQLSADPTLNPYWLDVSNEGCFAAYMLGLTEADLSELSITPGRLVCNEVVDGPRPEGNRPDRPTPWRHVQQEMEWINDDCIGQPRSY